MKGVARDLVKPLLALVLVIALGELLRWALRFVTVTTFGGANVDMAMAVGVGLVLADAARVVAAKLTE